MSKGMGTDMGTGAQLIYDAQHHTVHLWQWQWQWWSGAAAPKAFGPVTVHLADDLSYTTAEVRCASGFAARQKFSEGWARLSNVPLTEDCTLSLRVGPPNSFPVQGEHAFSCYLAADGLVCQQP